MRPVLFVTGHAPPYRAAGLARLHEIEGIEVALFGGRLSHGFGDEGREGGTPRADAARADAARADATRAEDLPFPHRRVRQREIYGLAASGRYRAIVCSTAGRLALPAAWAGGRRRGVPVLLWTSLWAHPRSAAHVFSYLALKRLYRTADAVVAYGPHVAAYARARGARNVHLAPQAVDNAFWGSAEVRPPSDPRWPIDAAVKFLFVGRPVREKGLGVLGQAWTISGLQAPTAALVLVGVGPTPPWVPAGGAVASGGPSADAPGGPAPGGAEDSPGGAVAPGVVGFDPVGAERLRDIYSAADVLVLPSIPTATFREPWGLVVNEAMNRGLPVIASDAVGAVVGGLVRDGRNGLVVPAGDPEALAGAMRRLAGDPALRARMGAAAKEDVAAYTPTAWAEGFSAALASIRQSRQTS